MPANSRLQSASAAVQSDRSRLLGLPNEILQAIVCCLARDRDVLHLSQCCKEMWARVFGPDSAIWRYRFSTCYDLVPGKLYRELKIEYQIRAIVLRAPIQFKGKEDDRQYLWMEVMQTMLEESLNLPIAPGETSKTLQCIRETLQGVDFLSEFQKEGTSSQLFYGLQLCLTSFALDPTITEPCRRTDYDITQVYSYLDEVGQAFIDHDDLDLAKLLNLRNFWQRHFLNASEISFNESFSGLPTDMKPKTRKDNPTNISKLSPSWLGYYSCMHPLSDLLHTDRQTCADLETHGDLIDIMNLDLQPSSYRFWPEQCNKIIPIASVPDTMRTYFNGKQRGYGGVHEEENPVFGFTEDIPAQHGGFGGWTRICFMILEAEEEEGEEEEEEEEEEDDEMPFSPVMDGEGWIHGYEAVIIPGGRMMLGRWVDMKEPEARGPFIFWDV